MRQIVLRTDGRLYEQICQSIKDDITAGRLLKGEKLPSSRLLAEELNVSRTTVSLAYDQLLSEGYIEAKERRGYFVSDVGVLTVTPAHTEERTHTAPEQTDTTDKKSDIRIDFSPHGVDISGFPFPTWKRLTGQALLDEGEALFARGDPMGDIALRQEIARYLTSSRGVRCDASQIVIGAGDDYLLLLLQHILGNRTVAFEAATYTRAARIFASGGCEIVTVDTDEAGMSASSLAKSGASLAFVMPARQYPTGIPMPIGRRRELIAWAQEGDDRFLIEDDYDSEFRYRTRPIPAMQASDTTDSVIYLGTFSKSIAPAIRVGYLALPARLMERCAQQLGEISCTVSRIDQAILSRFLREGYFARYLNKTRRLYRVRHDCALEELYPLTNRFTMSGEGAGLHLLLSVKSDPYPSLKETAQAEQKYIRAALKKGVRVYGLHEYLRTEDAAIRSLPVPLRTPTLIVGYAPLDESKIKEGASVLRSVLSGR